MGPDTSHDNSNQAAEKYRVLLEITNALVSNLDRDALFKAIASSIGDSITFDRAGITLYDPATDRFQIYALETTVPTSCDPNPWPQKRFRPAR